MTSKRSSTRKPAVATADSPARAVSKKAARTAGGGILAPIRAAIRARAGAAGAADAEAFTNAFYYRMGEDELPLHTADGWAALAFDFLEFARKRKPGTARMRLFNPTLKTHGWESPHTVLQIVNDDMPFLVDSVTMALAEQGIGVHVLGHPVIALRRDRGGRLQAVGEGEPESLMHLEIDRQPAESIAVIEEALGHVLGDVRQIVADWPAMRDRMVAVAEDLATRALPVDDAVRAEAQEFLRWASNDHFTFLGYREYQVRQRAGEPNLLAVEDSGLGLLRGKEVGQPRSLRALAAQAARGEGEIDPLILTKTNARSTVHLSLIHI